MARHQITKEELEALELLHEMGDACVNFTYAASDYRGDKKAKLALQIVEDLLKEIRRTI